MARLSTGLRNAVLSNYGLGLMMNGGIIRVYGGTRPTTPDLPPGTTELGRITTEGKVFIPDDDPYQAGLIVVLAPPATVLNAGTWVLKGVATGIPTWWRWCWSATDPLIDSDYYPRVDGLVGSELVLSLTTIYPTTSVAIDQFILTMGLGS